jgi:hypothetical protein
MKRVRAALVMLAMVVPAFSASAATVGLDGGDTDPIPLTDPTWQELMGANCAVAEHPLPADYRCALYDGTAVALLTSIDFRLKDGNNDLIPAPDGITGDTIAVLLPFFSVSPLFPDGYTFRLTGSGHCDTCVFFSSHPGGLEDPLFVSIVGVNGVPNPDTELIPEPATLVLFGPGAMIALRRLRARRKRN